MSAPVLAVLALAAMATAQLPNPDWLTTTIDTPVTFTQVLNL